MLFEIVLVIVLILVNGGLAMSELAIVSARPARLQALARAGSRGAETALRLAGDPGKFLSAVQIGITAVGVLSGAFSGATLGARLAGWLTARGLDPDWAQALGVGSVVIVLTYLSLIVGELVPKQIALRNPAGVAALVAPVMAVIARVAAPVVWLLDRSGKLVLWFLGQSGGPQTKVTEEEVQSLLSEAQHEGLIEREERMMLSGVMRLADRSARALMTPRREVAFVNAGMPPDQMLAAIRATGHDRIPVLGDNPDEVLGVMCLIDAFAALSRGEALDPVKLLRPAPAVLEATDAIDLMRVLRAAPSGMVLVYDEYGGFQGLVTSGNILEAITAGMSDRPEDAPQISTRADGSLLVEGAMAADEFADRLGISRAVSGDYTTVAGLVLNQLHRMPVLGDIVTIEDWCIEVIDMDGLRIDKVLVSKV